MHKPLRIKIKDLNEHLICILCGGYFVNATRIIECLHSFCRSCIVKYVETNRYCPICEVQIHKTKPLLNLRSDQTLQDIVYKLVPGLFQNEMQRRRQFYSANPTLKPQDPEQSGELIEKSHVYTTDDYISLSLEYSNDDSSDTGKQTKRYLRCPAAVSIQHLQKLIRAKYGLLTENKVDIIYQNDTLSEDLTLIDIAFKYLWKRKGPLHLTYRIFETQSRKKVKLNHDYNNDNSEHPDGPSNTISVNVNNATTTTDDIKQNTRTVDIDLNTENDQNTSNNLGTRSLSDFLEKIKSSDNKILKHDENKQVNVLKTAEINISPLPDENIANTNKIPLYSNNDSTAVSVANFNNNQLSFSFGSNTVQSTDVEMTEVKKDIKVESVQNDKINDSNKHSDTSPSTVTDSKTISEVVFSSTQINTSTQSINIHTKTTPNFPESLSASVAVEKEVQLQISESGVISVTTNSPSENNPVSPNTVFASKSPIPNLISISTSDSIVFSTPQTSRTVPNLISVDAVSKKPDLKSVRKENVKIKDGVANSKDNLKIKDNVISVSDQKAIVSSVSLPVYSIATSTASVNSVTSQSSPVLVNSNQVVGSKRKICEPETSTCKVQKTSEQSALFNSPKAITSTQNSNVKTNIKTPTKVYQIPSNVNLSKSTLKPVNVSTVKPNTHSQKCVSQPTQPISKSASFEGEANTSNLKNIKQVNTSISKIPQSPVKKSTTVGYKTLRDPPKTWNPTLPIRTFGQISQNIVTSKNQNSKIGPPEVNASTSQTTKIATQPKPAKFFKARNNMPRYLGNPASGVKPMYQISQNTSDANNTVVSNKNDILPNVSTAKLNMTSITSSVKNTVSNAQTNMKTNEGKNGIPNCSSNISKTSDDTKLSHSSNSKSGSSHTSSSVNSLPKTSSDSKTSNKCNTNENILNDSKNNLVIESNNSLENSTDEKEQNVQNLIKSEKSISCVSASTTVTKDLVSSKLNSDGNKSVQTPQGSFCLKTKGSKPISNRSSPMTVSEMLQLRNSSSPKVNHIHDVKKENNLSKNVENINTIINSNTDKNAVTTDIKSDSSCSDKCGSFVAADGANLNNAIERNEADMKRTRSEKVDGMEKVDDFKNKSNLIENVNTELIEQTDSKNTMHIVCNIGNNDDSVNDDNKAKSSNFIKIDPNTLKPLTIQTKNSENSNVSSSKSLNKDKIKLVELNLRENTPQNELKITQTTVPIYSPIRQKYKHDLKSQKNSPNLNTGNLNSTKIDVKPISSSKLDIPNSIKIPIGSMLDRSSPKSPKISSLNISNLIKPELTVTSSPHSPKFDRSSPKTFMSSPKLDRSSSKSPLNSLKYDSSKSSILGSPKSQLSPLIDRASPKNQTSPKNQQISPKSQRNLMKTETNTKSNSNLLSTSKSSTNVSKSQKSESCLSMAQKFGFMSSNPFVSNLSSPNISPNQFLFSNYMNSAVAAMSYDPRLHHNLSNLAAFHNLPLNLSHLLYNQHRLPYSGAATSNLNPITNQSVSNLNAALLSGNLSTSSNQSLASSNNVCNSVSSCVSTVSSRPNQISSEIECKTPGVKNESEKSKKQ